MNEQEQNMRFAKRFGCPLATLESMIDKTATAPSIAIVAVSILSDSQELIERGRNEEARQAINRAKWLMAQIGRPVPMTLVDGQMIVTDSVEGPQYSIVGSVEGYARKYQEDPAIAFKRAVERGHEVAWANKQATVICNSPSFYAHEDAERAKAITVNAGALVEIEGRRYKVTLTHPRYSDFVKFTPVK